jgi:hypothetical protein
MATNDEKPDYDVGYGKPPKDSQFQAGESGNPNGRPKGSHNIGTMVREAMEEVVVINKNGNRRHVSKLNAGMIRLADKIATGNLEALRFLLPLLLGLEKQWWLENREVTIRVVHDKDGKNVEMSRSTTLARNLKLKSPSNQ